MWCLGRTRVITEASKTIRWEQPFISGSDGEGIRMWHVSCGEIFHLMSHQKVSRNEGNLVSHLGRCVLRTILWSTFMQRHHRNPKNKPPKSNWPQNDINFHWKHSHGRMILWGTSYETKTGKKTVFAFCIQTHGTETSPEKTRTYTRIMNAVFSFLHCFDREQPPTNLGATSNGCNDILRFRHSWKHGTSWYVKTACLPFTKTVHHFTHQTAKLVRLVRHPSSESPS